MQQGSQPQPEASAGRGGAINYLVVGFFVVVVGMILLVPPRPEAAMWALGGFFGLVFTGLIVFAVRTWLQDRAERALFERGRKATAVVEGVRTTGLRVNDDQQIVLRLRVRPLDGNEFPHERRLFVPMHRLPRIGDVIEVAHDPADRTRVALATDWRSGTGGARRQMLRPEGVAHGAGGGVEGDANERVVQQLERLDRLRQSGSLTFTEFEALKARILSGQDG
jgi:hypothetical protein